MFASGDTKELIQALAFFGVDVAPEPLWEKADLGEAQLAEFAAHEVRLRERVAIERPGDEWWSHAHVYLAALWDMGVACDHPEKYRSGWPSDADLEEMCEGIEGALFYEMAAHQSWECGACGIVMSLPPRDIEVAVFVGGPRDGQRAVVPRDAMLWEVPVTPEILSCPVGDSAASVSPWLSTATYRRTGRGAPFGVEFAVVA